jgi:hypothetical protein
LRSRLIDIRLSVTEVMSTAKSSTAAFNTDAHKSSDNQEAEKDDFISRKQIVCLYADINKPIVDETDGDDDSAGQELKQPFPRVVDPSV